VDKLLGGGRALRLALPDQSPLRRCRVLDLGVHHGLRHDARGVALLAPQQLDRAVVRQA
jgi:hypothetical protein